MSNSFPGGLIRKTPVTPAGPYQDGAAPGVWSLSEAAYWTKQGLWPIAGNTVPIALFAGAGISTYGDTPSNVIEKIIISTLSNSTDFGDLGSTSNNTAACSSSTLGVFASINGGGSSNVMSYVTIATSGNSTYFGALTISTDRMAGSGSSTRGLFFGGRYQTNVIQYITFATIGNATDFGDLVGDGREYASSCSSPTRSIIANGYFYGSPFFRNTIDYVTIATTGNSTDFGDTTVIGYDGYSVSSSTRGVIGCGYDSGTYALNVINYVTIASTGNASDFGDLSSARYGFSGASSQTRGVFAGGLDTGNTPVNTIDYVTIQTTGNTTDFGDLLNAQRNAGGCSNAHGGLA